MTGRKSGKALVAIAVVLTLLAAFVIAGFTGLLFRVWPASFPDTDLVVTPQVIEELKQLRAEPKFKPDPKNFYPYFDRILRILGAQGSNQLLNVWRYGFPYGWALKGA